MLWNVINNIKMYLVSQLYHLKWQLGTLISLSSVMMFSKLVLYAAGVHFYVSN